MPMLTWCPICGDDLHEVGWKMCPECGEELCRKCYPEHMDLEHDITVLGRVEPDEED